MIDQNVISANHLTKVYRIWDQPSSRVLAPAMEKLARVMPERAGNSMRERAARHYRDFHALHDVTFNIRRGESVGIIGKNGSGKSTLLQLVTGVLHPTSGDVAVRGRIGALLELGSGFNPEFTGRENVYLAGALLGIKRETIEDQFEEIEKFADIGEFINEPVKTYSSGMAVRLGFSIQTAITPEVLIIDEALAVGDEAFQSKCIARLKAMQREGTTLLFVSHSAGQVVQLCDRAMLLDHGRLICEGQPKDVVNYYHMMLYKGRPVEQETSRADVPKEAKNWVITASNDEQRRDSAFFGEVPQNTAMFTYPRAGGFLEELRILSQDGREVNYLRRGVAYTYQYHATATSDLKGVRFGAALRTVTGLELAGMASHTNLGRIPEVGAGSHFTVRFHFQCRLLPGTYFLNAGFLALDGTGQEYFVHRIVDGLLFRVCEEVDLPVNGTVDFLLRAEVANGA